MRNFCGLYQPVIAVSDKYFLTLLRLYELTIIDEREISMMIMNSCSVLIRAKKLFPQLEIIELNRCLEATCFKAFWE